MTRPDAPSPAKAQLGLGDTISIIVGIVIGVSIFRVPPAVFANTSDAWEGLAAWLAGGLLSLLGAFCFAELATTYPRSGGIYVYLTRAFGPSLGFLFGWAQLVAIATGSIGAVAYVFADYSVELFDTSPRSAVWFAVAAVMALTLANLLGLGFGKTTQNVLTLAKIIGLLLVIGAGVAATGPAEIESIARERQGPGNFGLAMILILFAYGGWSDAAYVTAEIRQPQRNIPWALAGGIGAITLLYLLVNVAYLAGLGLPALRESQAPAADLLREAIGPASAHAISLLVMVSALGAVSGMVLTGSRVYTVLGEDHSLFRGLAHQQRRSGAPLVSLLVQAAVSVVWILAVGSTMGRGLIDAVCKALHLPALPWERFGGGFDTLIAATAPVFWLFFLLTGVALLVLRRKDRDRPRPFETPWHPLVPIVFCATSLYMLLASVRYAGTLSLLGLVSLAVGVPLYVASRKLSGDKAESGDRKADG